MKILSLDSWRLSASDRLPPSLRIRLPNGSIHWAQVGASSPWQANSHLGQLVALSLRQIAAKFEEKTAQWFHSLGTGGELVVPGRQIVMQITNSQNLGTGFLAYSLKTAHCICPLVAIGTIGEYFYLSAIKNNVVFFISFL
jgi:hypothetical protein